jgi:tetratricopeptide (TPR) repeat protein
MNRRVASISIISALIALGAPLFASANPERGAQFAHEATRLYAQGRLREAITAMNAAVAADPANAQLYFMQGTALFRAHDYAAACCAYEQAVILRWEHPDTHVNLGFARYHSGREPEALESWREAVRQAPADPLAHLALALGEWRCGDPDAALLEIDLATALGDPVALLDETLEVRWGRQGTDEMQRLLAVWRGKPAHVHSPSSSEAAR